MNVFNSKETEVLKWMDEKKAEVDIPVYTSCDIRNSGSKLATVDTNLFPAGWNNLCPSYQKIASKHFRDYFDENHPGIQCILILTEEHTRNPYYFSNVKALVSILESAEFTVYVGSPSPELTEATVFETADNESLKVHPVVNSGNSIMVADQKVCLVLLNNDFSSGLPDLMNNIEQPVVPSPDMGWHKRMKSDHFAYYNGLIDEFAHIIGFDPWHMKAEFDFVNDVDINNDEDRARIAESVDKMIERINRQYAERGLECDTTIFVKNNSGTYGMGVIPVKSGEDILSLNRKARNKLSVGKGGATIQNFLLQEGIPTADKVKGLVAEPVIYIAGGEVAGGFFRVNENKGEDDNLNSPGMTFVKLCFAEVVGYENEHAGECDLDCLDKLYRLVGQIAAIAAGREELSINE